MVERWLAGMIPSMEVGNRVKERGFVVVVVCLFVSMWTSQGSVAGPTVEGG